jgi:hypothetical protein
MEQLADRIEAVSEACKDADSDEARDRIDAFIKYSIPRFYVSTLTSPDRILIRDSAQIEDLRKEATWKKMLENEGTAKRIEDILQGMDQSLATFEVGIPLFNRFSH